MQRKSIQWMFSLFTKCTIIFLLRYKFCRDHKLYKHFVSLSVYVYIIAITCMDMYLILCLDFRAVRLVALVVNIIV